MSPSYCCHPSPRSCVSMQVPDISSQLNELQNAISGIGGNIRDGQNELTNVLGPQVMEQINSSLQREHTHSHLHSHTHTLAYISVLVLINCKLQYLFVFFGFTIDKYYSY